jgi:hypothetical protein
MELPLADRTPSGPEVEHVGGVFIVIDYYKLTRAAKIAAIDPSPETIDCIRRIENLTFIARLRRFADSCTTPTLTEDESFDD